MFPGGPCAGCKNQIDPCAMLPNRTWGVVSRLTLRSEADMESELLYSKERLALERKAQQHSKPITEDRTGAAWAHMKRRLLRAEREARLMRRLTMALFCIALAGAAGVIAMAPPWSEAIVSRGSAGRALVRPADAWTPLQIHAGASPAAPRGPAPDSNHVHPLRGYPVHAALSPDRTPLRLLGASDSPGLPPGGVRQAGQGTGSSSSQGRSAGGPAKLSRPSPHPVQQPGTRATGGPEQPRGFRRAGARMNHTILRWVGSGSRQAARHSVRWRHRSLSRSRWSSRYMGHGRYWRVLRVSRTGPVNCCLVDPHGNWWEARRVQPRRVHRGEKGK